MTTPTSIRIPAHVREKGEIVARVRGVSFNRLVVDVLTNEIENSRQDPTFIALVETLINEDRTILERLAAQ